MVVIFRRSENGRSQWVRGRGTRVQDASRCDAAKQGFGNLLKKKTPDAGRASGAQGRVGCLFRKVAWRRNATFLLFVVPHQGRVSRAISDESVLYK